MSQFYRWLVLLVSTIIIYGSSPFMRAVVIYLFEANLMRLTLAIICLLSLILSVWILHFKFKLSLGNSAVLLAPVSVVFSVFFFSLENYSERVHIPEYAFLATLCFYCLDPIIKNRKYCYLSAFLLVAFLGATDEFIQHLIPTRYGEWRDVEINVLAGLFGLGITFSAQKLKEIQNRGH